MTDEPKTDHDLMPIVARLDAVQDLVKRVSDEVGPHTVRGAELIIERYRPEVYAAMEALGLEVHEFLLSEPSPNRLAAAQVMVIDRLRESTLTSPISLYGSEGKRPRLSYFEVVEHIRAGRVAGADVAARVLDDYYLHTRIGQAFINRIVLLNQRLADEVASCQADDGRPIDLISLQYVGGNELMQFARDAELLARARVICIDSDAVAVRHAEQTLRNVFNRRLQVVLADPARWLHGPSRSSNSACVVYALQLLEQLAPKRVVRVLEGAHRVLQTGGVLLIGATSGRVPVGERMIRDWLLGWDWKYRSESEWRELFAQTPFDAGHLTFEYEPLGIHALIRAQKAD